MRVFLDNDKKEFTIVMSQAEIFDWRDETKEAWVLNAVDGLTPIGKKIILSLAPSDSGFILWPNFVQDKEMWAESRVIKLKLANYSQLKDECCFSRITICKKFEDFEIYFSIVPDIEV